MSSNEYHSLLQKIQDLVSAEKVALKRHCVLRMRQRSISVDEFKEAMLHAEIVENYEDDYPFPSSLILGFTASRRPLHAVIAMDQKSDFLWVITLYEPTIESGMQILRKGESEMYCPLCKANMEEGTTILPFDMKNGRVIVVLNVPARICEQCGEEFVDMAVVRNVEALLERAERDGLSMGFLEYGLAA